MDWNRQASYDLTNFGDPERFARVLSDLGIGLSCVEHTEFGFRWEEPNGAGYLFTCNNPITGDYNDPELRRPSPGYASYIGVEGTNEFVEKAIESIAANAVAIKDMDFRGRSYA